MTAEFVAWVYSVFNTLAAKGAGKVGIIPGWQSSTGYGKGTD
jgi:hypothetical protein